MLPESIHNSILKKIVDAHAGLTIDMVSTPSLMPVQVFRAHELRESNLILSLNEKEYLEYIKYFAIPLISKMFINNIGHGAINHENLSFGGKILDLGHTGPGLPMMSTSHRCLMRECSGEDGSDMDFTIIGILDHYLGRSFLSSDESSWHDSSSYTGSTKYYNGPTKEKKHLRNLHRSFIDELIITILMDAGGNEPKKITNILRSGFLTLINNKIHIDVDPTSLFEKIFKNKKLQVNISDSRQAISTQFIIQLSIIKNLYPKRFKNFFNNNLIHGLNYNNSETYQKKGLSLLINFFSSHLKDIDKVNQDKFFTFFLPRSVMEQEVEEKLKGVRKYKEIKKKSSELLKELEKGQYVTPLEFLSMLESIFTSS